MTKETYDFQAQVSKVLDIVVHSLYSHSEIFLRELISNAADACDKLRYLSLTTPDLMKNHGPFKITLTPDKKNKTLTITDNGIGMDKKDLIENIGTIAHSGSAEFAKHLTGDNKKDAKLIGQFGVGFYSAFMVADSVEILSKKAGTDIGYKWTSAANGSFEIEDGVETPVGTSITLHLKDDFLEYTDPMRLRFIVRQYSNHISIPIVLLENGKEETINSASALWTQNKTEITPEQYKDFYQNLTHNFDSPYLTLHYNAEGVICYTALLFIPQKAPFDLFQPDKKHGLNLYVNRVFISDEVDELLPHYFRFVRGVIDTSELPLNVSREMLQHTPVLSKIKKGIVHKLLDALDKKSKEESYSEFWNQFGIVFKEGLYEDKDNHEKIAKLCRFHSTKSDDLTTLDDYISRMPEKQKNIYYLTGDDINLLKTNPSLEGFTSKGIEVLLLDEPIDEFWPQVFNEYQGKKILSITHPDEDINDILGKDEDDNSLTDGQKTALIERIKQVIGDDVFDVEITNRLHKSPTALVAGKGQMSIHLERLMKQHGQKQAYASNRIFQINPKHPLIQKLADDILNKKDDILCQNIITILYEQARVAEGEPLKDPAGFMEKINTFIEKALAN